MLLLFNQYFVIFICFPSFISLLKFIFKFCFSNYRSHSSIIIIQKSFFFFIFYVFMSHLWEIGDIQLSFLWFGFLSSHLRFMFVLKLSLLGWLCIFMKLNYNMVRSHCWQNFVDPRLILHAGVHLEKGGA